MYFAMAALLASLLSTTPPGPAQLFPSLASPGTSSISAGRSLHGLPPSPNQPPGAARSTMVFTVSDHLIADNVTRLEMIASSFAEYLEVELTQVQVVAQGLNPLAAAPLPACEGKLLHQQNGSVLAVIISSDPAKVSLPPLIVLEAVTCNLSVVSVNRMWMKWTG
mmetsp:Transcript_40791/g.101353  ORF Transcript_40791/g.101353 Transcript_40791/m.101353 type:complete len:165 (+) Transcript_40791:647-1141(+)